LLVLHNSMTRRIERFKPLSDREVKMFTCGPSTYQRQHIGNYRTFLFEDVLQRYLEYKGCRVIRTLNFTDIEDKSIKEAQKEKMDIFELTQPCAHAFFEDMRLLKIKPPTYNPRSSTSIDQAVLLIQQLLKNGNAYWYRGNVYFDPLTFRDFGKLAHLDMSRWPRKKRCFHRDTYPGNPWNLGDFILWHGYRKGDTVYRDTAIGRGRPAWNIQDPAMVIQTLGFSIDIFCGGEDNLVRHHDYIIAVVESVSGKPLARYWLHCSHLLVNGKKMSKSKGNIIYIDDILKEGYTGEEIRFFLIYGYYRRRLDFSYDRLRETVSRLRQAHGFIKAIQNSDAGVSDKRVKGLSDRLKLDFEKNLDNDLHVKQAFDSIFHTLSQLARFARTSRVASADAKGIISTLRGIDSVLQVFKLNDEPLLHEVD